LSSTIETKAIAVIVGSGGVALTVKVLEGHFSERQIMDMNSRLMYVLAGDDDGPLVKKDVLTTIVKMIGKKSHWKIPNLYYLKTLNLISANNAEVCLNLKKLAPLLSIISLISGKRNIFIEI
jgi:hypothetical protein